MQETLGLISSNITMSQNNDWAVCLRKCSFSFIFCMNKVLILNSDPSYWEVPLLLTCSKQFQYWTCVIHESVTSQDLNWTIVVHSFPENFLLKIFPAEFFTWVLMKEWIQKVKSVGKIADIFKEQITYSWKLSRPLVSVAHCLCAQMYLLDWWGKLSNFSVWSINTFIHCYSKCNILAVFSTQYFISLCFRFFEWVSCSTSIQESSWTPDPPISLPNTRTLT